MRYRNNPHHQYQIRAFVLTGKITVFRLNQNTSAPRYSLSAYLQRLLTYIGAGEISPPSSLQHFQPRPAFTADFKDQILVSAQIARLYDYVSLNLIYIASPFCFGVLFPVSQLLIETYTFFRNHFTLLTE